MRWPGYGPKGVVALAMVSSCIALPAPAVSAPAALSDSAAPRSSHAAALQSRLAAPPSPPVWPIPELVDDIRGLLIQYYNQEASIGTPYYYLAPEWESDKAPARKDPDTLFEYYGGPGTACHSATTDAEFVNCTGSRLAATFSLPYEGGLTLFAPARGYYANDAYAQMAGFYALYHAFVRDFDAPVSGAYTADSARNAKRYHERMIQAYEAHASDIIAKMFRDTRSNGQFQADLTRSAGLLAMNYGRVVQAMEEMDLWPSPSQRRDALNVLNGLGQRIWWEWVWTQNQGPRTAGFADLGSEATYTAAAEDDPRWLGTNQFTYQGVAVPSLRPAALDTGARDGLWFDADYTVPGEWWCYGRYASNSDARARCLALAARESIGGDKSPFGQYYGPADGVPNCDSRAGSATSKTCAVANLGSIAEEWTWTFVGGRWAMFIMKELAASGDPDLPQGAIGPTEYDEVTEKVGYGIAGWHGGAGYHDDLEWNFLQPERPVVAIRTLSSASHDMEMQDGRFSLGETDVSASGGGRDGDTFGDDGQEYPGGIENHVPGPNPLYGSFLFSLVLGDETSDGLSPSFYDAWHRNNYQEFLAWVWLMQSTYYRCVGVEDPADGRCLAFSTAYWPNPAQTKRTSLYTRPEDSTVNVRFRYLWRDASGAVDEGHIGERDRTCRGDPGLPWRSVHDWTTGLDSGFLFDEGGYGAYNELLQGLGGMLRLLAARHPLVPVNPAELGDYLIQRTDVIEPWYGDAFAQVKSILELYKRPFPVGYGYVPDIENSTCKGYDPRAAGDPGNAMMLSWQVGTADSVMATTVRRAMWYSTAALWYWWYDSDWLDADAAVW